MSSNKAVIYYLTPGEVRGEMCQSMIEMLVHDATDGGGHIAGIVRVRSSALLAEARNGCVRQFLEYDGADWLMFIDSDMVWDHDALDRLFAHADAETAPIVGGLCCGLDEVAGWFPTTYKFGRTEDGTPAIARVRPESRGLVRVDATGSAFILIHRSVLQKMADKAAAGTPGFNPVYPWFQETNLASIPVGEDVTFCMRAAGIKAPIYVDCDTEIGHVKTITGRYSTHIGWGDEA